jgi:hypothetical protein
MRKYLRDLLAIAGFVVLIAATACVPALASSGASGTLVAANCAPVAAAENGMMVWYSMNSSGVWDVYEGNGNCQGQPLLAPYAGNRGPAGITADGRYVLLTTAVGIDKTLRFSAPGQGSGNAIQLYDRQTRRLSTLLPGGTASQRGVIWPTFNSDASKIVWSQMIKTAAEDPPVGQWALHVADVNLAAGTLSNNVEWQDPNSEANFYEAYGWIPNTNRVVFMSGTRATSSGFRAAQLFTLPDELNPSATPTRISPQFAPVWPWQTAVDVFHEFAHFAPGDPYTLYTSLGADTVGGDDLFAYDLRTQGTNGVLGQPSRISYFGGDLNANMASQAIAGWPTPSYIVVTTMAWVNGAWVITTCPDLLCSTVAAWRVEDGGAPSLTKAKSSTSGSTTPTSASPPAGAGATVSGRGEVAPGQVSLLASKLRVSGGRAMIELRCAGRGLCRGSLTLSARHTSGRRHARRAAAETIGRAQFTILPDMSAGVRLTVSAAGRALLAGAHGTLSALLTIASAGSGSGVGTSSGAQRLSRPVRISGLVAAAKK